MITLQNVASSSVRENLSILTRQSVHLKVWRTYFCFRDVSYLIERIANYLVWTSTNRHQGGINKPVLKVVVFCKVNSLFIFLGIASLDRLIASLDQPIERKRKRLTFEEGV